MCSETAVQFCHRSDLAPPVEGRRNFTYNRHNSGLPLLQAVANLRNGLRPLCFLPVLYNGGI